jgi:2-oxoglutarate-Fe(II)-dependent oxygenase superfamily protein
MAQSAPPPPDFIEVYDDALDAAACRKLVERFEASRFARRGETGGGVDVSVKDSWDISLHEHPGWSDAQQLLNNVVLVGFKRYLRRYAHMALATSRLQVPAAGGAPPVTLDAERLAQASDDLLNKVVMHLFRPGTINLQKYLADKGSYPYWHCELHPSPEDQGESLHRVVLWTLYLNDKFSAGETEFFYQRRKIVPKTGSLLIAPTAFTHTHRGNMPKGGDKYIATGWVLFQRRASASGAPQSRR